MDEIKSFFAYVLTFALLEVQVAQILWAIKPQKHMQHKCQAQQKPMLHVLI